MPWAVRRSSDCPPSRPWACYNITTGETEGCHETEEAASAQQAALYANTGHGKHLPGLHDQSTHGRPGVKKLKKLIEQFLNGEIDDPFEGVSAATLAKVAKERGITVPKGASKSEIADLILSDLGKKPASPKRPSLFGHTSIDDVPTEVQKKIFAAYKAQPHGQLLSSPTHASYDNLVAIAHVYGKDAPGGLSPGQIAAIVDDRLAFNQGLTNQHLLGKKIRDWLATADGAAYAKAHTDPDKDIVASLTGGVVLPGGITLKPGQKVQQLGGPGKYKASDTDFPVRSAYEVQKLQDDHEAAAGFKMTPQQYKALVNYTGGGYSGMNNYLRDKADAPNLVRQQIVQAQSAMLPAPANLQLIRGTGFDQLPEGYRDPASVLKLVGKTIQEPGFTSTAISGTGGEFSGQVRLIIEAPAGTPGRFVSSLSLHPSENEFLLAAGTKFRVLSVSNGTSTEIRLRVVTPK